MSTAPADSQPVGLVRVLRSGFHESSHFGSVVIVDSDGSLLHSRGDVDAPIFPRSSSKPFQAVAILRAGAMLEGADLALSAASHSGEPMHVQRALDMLARVSLAEDDLGCPPALPLNEVARNEVIASGGAPRRIFMNCSGKHAGMLSACVEQGWDTRSYLGFDHPLQRSVHDQIARLADERPAAVGIDGW